ncbi:MAG: hypothetical protein R3360_08250, partial [Alphaproteobacteria bacterium]|nr:hypothetical protein [Alphaproteobacteria bacterium]
MERLNKKELERVNKREKPAADKPDSHTYLFVVLAVVASFLPITVLANTAAVGGAGSAALLVLGGMVAGIAGMGVLGRTGQAQRISADTQASSDREEPAVPLIAANQNAANDDGSAKRREAALQEKMALLKQRNKAICEAARGVAHDFNNLLMTIQGSLELIHSDPG